MRREGLLGEVLGRGGVVHDEVRGAICARPVSAKERLEIGGRPSLGAAHPGTLVTARARHRVPTIRARASIRSMRGSTAAGLAEVRAPSYASRAMPACACCRGEVEERFRFCPWCGAAQRVKIVEFFAAHPLVEEDPEKALRVSRYLGDAEESTARSLQRVERARGDAAGRGGRLAHRRRGRAVGPLPRRHGARAGTADRELGTLRKSEPERPGRRVLRPRLARSPSGGLAEEAGGRLGRVGWRSCGRELAAGSSTTKDTASGNVWFCQLGAVPFGQRMEL